MIALIATLLSACSIKKTSSSGSVGSGSSPLTPNPTVDTPTGNGPSSSGSSTSCNGIYRDGVTKCYYRNIPSIIASGGTYGQTWWSSTNFVASSGVSPAQFSTDATFNVRIVPRIPSSTDTSTFGKACSQWMTNASKLKVQLMLHKNGVSVGEVATLTSSIDTPSKVWHFQVPVTADPLVLEVVNVLSDSRCSGKYGSIPTSCKTNVYMDIPVNTKGPTECVAFDIHMSTDETYDLPGESAN